MILKLRGLELQEARTRKVEPLREPLRDEP